ncbi:rhoptry kinase family protein rop37 (incomplete catalytic triad) [Cystoisospora suis]|uniref:Rhoptry kinase family protein rop37 (Incomplete catalytic triad) n=1 Tax=Cystoisospora suis TaxID=483139 RepID=A0A2C6LAL9_9APIC|nr:rhoptry kinase family protein rop37 (incomplete catalytic triad) [Cystoisospora suis]
MTPSGPVSASGEYQQGHREQGAGGIGAGAGPEVLGPWVVPRNVRVKNSELAAGRQELLAIARELFFPGGADTETGHSPGEAMPLLLPPPGGEQAELAFEKLFPVDTVYHCRDENGQFKVLGVGRVLAVGSSGVVCLAADITDLTRARKYAAKFYYSLLVLDSESDIKYGNSVIIQTERRARSSREKLLSKVSSEQELLQHGVAVPRGFYTLDWSRRPPPRQMNTPLITSVRKGGGSFTTSYVLFGSHVMVMPLLGPDLFHIFQRDRTDNVLKYTFVMLVRRVAYLNSLGLVHRDIKPSNIAVSPETGELFLADLEFVGDMGAESRCQDYLSRRYVAPERAKCIVEGTAKYLVDEWVDSWALGVSLYFILCGSDLPFGHFEVSTAEDLLERYQENFKILLQSLNRETFMGDRCPRMKESHVALMDIVRLLLDPHKPTRWTARRLVQEHPFFQVAQD